MAGRCAALCQHPGCWHSGEKHNTKGRECPGYKHYIDYVMSKRKTRSPNSTTTTRDDGLPYLTVTDFSNELPSVFNHSPLYQSSSHPVNNPLQPSNDKLPVEKKLASTSMRFSIDSPFSIDRGRSPSPPPPLYDQYWFTPVLIWQPSKKKVEKKSNDKDNGRLLKTTNLTDALPDLYPCKDQPKEKRPISKVTRRLKGFKLSMDQYIIEGLSDVPPHIVNQIIQELHSQSSADVVPVQEPSNRESFDPNHVLPYSPPSPSPLYKPSPHDTGVPSSLMFNLHSKRITNNCSRAERQNILRKQSKLSKGGNMSYSRVLASQPQKALTGLKTRVARLQEDDDHYYMFNKPQNVNTTCEDEGGTPLNQDPLTMGSKFPKSDSIHPQTTSIQSGPSCFVPRSLNKATIQRLNCHVTIPNKTLQFSKRPGLLDLSVSSARSKLRKSNSHLQIPPRPSVHIPLLSIPSRPFSEELQTDPPGSESYTRPESHSAVRSCTSSSRVSSDHLIISADLAIKTGELLLLNRAGKVVHQVTETDTVVNGSIVSGDDYVKSDSVMENGSVAPPPTARNEESIESLVNGIVLDNTILDNSILDNTT